MNLEKISFENIEDLRYIMRRPWKTLNFTSVNEIIEIMKNTDKKITVHLYPLGIYRGKRKTLLNMYEWSYHQIYLAIKDDKIFCCMGHGDSSVSRERHNHLIDLFLEDKELQKQVPTAVLVVCKNILLAYYFHETYSYSNHPVMRYFSES